MGQWLEGFGGMNPASLYYKLRKEFSYLTADEFDSAEFFNYRRVWYCVGDFLRVIAAPHEALHGWDGYSSYSYFSGILLKYHHDGTVTVGRYSC